MVGAGSWACSSCQCHMSSIMRVVETLSRFPSIFGQAMPGFAVEEVSIAQSDIVSTMLNSPGKVFQSSLGRGQVRGPQPSSFPSPDNHTSKPVLCLSG